MIIPNCMRSILTGYSFEPVSIGKSGSSVYRCIQKNKPTYFFKASVKGHYQEFLYEKKVVQWLSKHISVPTIVSFEIVDNIAYMLMTEVEGIDATNLVDPIRLMAILAKTLKVIHQIPIQNCDLNQQLKKKMIRAKSNVDDKKVDESDFDDERMGMTALEVFRLLEEKASAISEDLVFTHGDYCLPNVILKEGQLSGIIDLGRAGVADRYQDIGLLLRSFEYNTGEKLEEIFLENYELIDSIDRDKVEFYKILDEFF